jgi:NADH dehydrogenase
MTEVPHVIVVGGGFGGLTAAKRLGRMSVRLTVVDRENHHLFQPLLYQVATAGVSPADIAVPIRSVLKKQENTRVILGEVVRVDLTGKRVVLDDGGALAYDYLIVAVGAKTNYFGHDEWSRYAQGMKSLDDAVEVRRRVLLAFETAEREADPDARRRLLTFVVIGGGPTGVEVAGALVELGRFVLADDFRHIRNEKPRVVLIEGAKRLIPGGFDQSMADSALRQLEALGVEVKLGAPVTGIDEHGVALGDEKIEASTILWTAGVQAKRLGKTLGVPLDRAGRVLVKQDCSVPGHPEVFVIGDAASFIPEGEKSPLPGVSPVAMQEARFVAGVIDDRLKGRAPPERFSYFDKGMMATIGRSRAVAQTGKLHLSGLVAWLAWLVVHIWYLIGFRNRIIVLINWAVSYVTYKRGARLITGERTWERALRMAAQAEHSKTPKSVLPEARQADHV